MSGCAVHPDGRCRPNRGGEGVHHPGAWVRGNSGDGAPREVWPKGGWRHQPLHQGRRLGRRDAAGAVHWVGHRASGAASARQERQVCASRACQDASGVQDGSRRRRGRQHRGELAYRPAPPGDGWVSRACRLVPPGSGRVRQAVSASQGVGSGPAGLTVWRDGHHLDRLGGG